MVHLRVAQGTISLALITLLSGCLGSSSTATTTTAAGGGGSSAYETAFDAATARVPTSDMPTTLNGNYKGQMKVAVNSGTTGLFGSAINPQSAEVIGDLDINVAWTDGVAGNPISGTASNFVATEAGTSNSVNLAGTLNVDNTSPPTISRVTTPAQTIAGIAIPETNTGAFQYTMSGTLENNGVQGETNILVGGSFFGSGATAMVGPVSGGIKEVGSTNPGLYDASIGGTAYAVKQ